MAFTAGSSSISAEINVTPLIDVLLVLVIIFMVIAPVASRGLGSELAQGKASAAVSVAPIVVDVAAGEGGRATTYRLGSREVALDELEVRLQALLTLRSDRTVYVRADRGLSYQRVAEVVSMSHHAGAVGVVLDGTR